MISPERGAGHPGRRTVVTATALTINGVFPVFLVAGLAVLIRPELGFSEAQLGMSVASFLTATSIFSVFGGRLADGVGHARSFLLAAVFTCTGLVLGGSAASWGQLTVGLALAGVGNGLTQPAANLVLARNVNVRRMALAFGIKQAAIPTAILVAGITLPLVAVQLGWRVPMFAAATIGLPIAILGSRLRATGAPLRSERRRRVTGRMALLTLACALGSASATALGTFLVEASVALGVSVPVAGAVLTTSSAVGILARISVGWFTDRFGGRYFSTLFWMLSAGAAGFTVLAWAQTLPLLLIGALLGFGAGWGWPGLMIYAAAKTHPEHPATASGIVQAGGQAGAAIGPFAFGVLIMTTGYSTAWVAAAVTAAIAAVMVRGAAALRGDTS